RLWVDRSFTIGGAGTVVTGTLPAGTLRTGDPVEIGPDGRRAVVRGLQSLGADRDEVGAVARVAVNLRGVPVDDVPRGTTLVTPGRWRPSSTPDVRLDPGADTADLPEQVMVHCGSAAVAAHVRPLDARHARLALTGALPLRAGDRMILREPGAERALGAADVPAAGRPGGWLLAPGAVPGLVERLTAALAEHARRDPLEPGLPVEAARRSLELPDARLLPVVLAHPAAAGIQAVDGRIVGAGGGEPELPEHVRAAVEGLAERFAARPFDAPTADELAELGLGTRELAACVRAGRLSRIGPGVWLGPDATAAAVEQLRRLPQPFTPSTARTHLDTSRRVVMPLLELLAREGLSRRAGDDGHVVE